jgi:hypothetical protein
MTVDKIIQQSDYNDIRNKVVGILGPGSGNSGYGQPVRSSAVAVGNRVSVTEWGNLYLDILNCYNHQFGSAPPSPATAVVHRPIRSNSTTSPYTQYDTFADTIVSNKFAIAQAITTSKGSTSSTWPGVYGTFWNATIQNVITISFSSSAAARYFFNSGGEVRFSSSLTGSTANAQTISWTNLLAGAGTRAFGGNQPGTGTSPADGTNFYRLTNSYQVWTSATTTSPYTSNQWRILARSPNVASNVNGTDSQVQFLVQWIDGYTDPGIVPGSVAFPQGTPSGAGTAGGGVQTATPADYPPGDEVYGTISLSVSTLEAFGVLQPVGAGNFSVESPSVSIGTIAP